MSLMRAHFARVSAQLQAAAAADPQALQATQGRTEMERWLVRLAADKAMLSGIQSYSARLPHKRRLLDEYAPYLEGVMAANKSPQDVVLVTAMLWAFDCGLLSRALQLAACALSNHMAMPEGHKRTLATVVAEECAEHIIKGDVDAAEAQPGDLAQNVRCAASITAQEDMPDAVRAKLHKALGLALRAAGELQEARACLQAALELDAGAGVKKQIEKLDADLRKHAQASA